MDLYQLLIFLFYYQGGFTPKMIFLLFCLLLCSCLTAVVGHKECYLCENVSVLQSS